MRVIFMGSPAFALPTLEALSHSHHTIAAVYSQPPRPAGRGQKLTPTPIAARAAELGLKVLTPLSLKSAEAQAEFAAHGADVAVVAAYGLLLPPAILQGCRLGCVNVHPSALPRWRGAAPIQRTLMAGDAHTAICIMQMEAGLDTGPILREEPFVIPPEMHAGALHDALAERGAALMLEVLAELEAGAVSPRVQPEAGVTYAHKITKEECRIDWTQPAARAHHHIRGLAPHPGAFTHIAGETVKILAAEIVAGSASSPAHPPGTVLDDALTIAAGDGLALRPTLVQRPGKKPMPTAEALRGWAIPPHSVCA